MSWIPKAHIGPTAARPLRGVNAVVSRLAIGQLAAAIACLGADPRYTDIPLAGSPGDPGHLDGQGAEARVRNTRFGCLDGAGNLYISESGTLRRISPAGEVRTLAGVAQALATVDGVGAEARFSETDFPIAANGAGTVYAIDPRGHCVRKITPRGEVTTLAGRPGVSGFQDGSGPAARFNSPWGIVVDSAGFIYVSDSGNRAIRRISPAGEVTTFTHPATFAGGPTGGLAIDGRDQVYVAESDLQFIHTINTLMPDGTLARTRWGEFGIRPRYIYDESEGINFRIDASGNLFVHVFDDGSLRRYTPDAVETDRFAPSGRGTHYSTSGLGLLAVDRSGVIFLVEEGVIKRRVLAAAAKETPVWSPVSRSPDHTNAGVAHGGGTFVLAGNREPHSGPQVPLISTSPDGVTWTTRSAPAAGTATAVHHVHDRFFIGLRSAVPASGDSAPIAAGTSILTSINGADWTSSDRLMLPGRPVDAPMSFAYGNGRYLAVVDPTPDFPAVVLSSADGLRWSARAIAGTAGSGPSQVVYFKDRFFVLAPLQGQTGSGLYASTDAHAWMPVTTAPAPLRGLAASSDVLLVTLAQPDESGAPGATTTDGASFRLLPEQTARYLGPGVRYVNHAFMALGGTTPESDLAPAALEIHASHDGQTWSTVGRIADADSAVVGCAGVAGRYVVATAHGVYPGLTDLVPGGQPGPRQPGSRLNHLAVRARIDGHDGTLTVGITLVETATGTSGGLLVRGLGPALNQFGIAAAGDPRLAWLSGQTIVASNDDWSATPDLVQATAAAGAFPLPAGSRDAALLLPAVRPGTYTLRATAADRGPGVTLVEVHDLTQAPPTALLARRLSNLSSLALTAPGADRLIAGFEVVGGPARVLIRASGPTLGQFDVRDYLADPRLELYLGSTLVAANDDWHPMTAPEPLQRRAGAFALPVRSRDAAITTTLPPGTYTVHVGGADAEAGLALVEVFELP